MRQIYINSIYIVVMLAVQARKRKRLHNKISQNETGEDTNFDIVVKKNKKKTEKPKGLTASEKNARHKHKKKIEKIKEKKDQKEDRERILKSLEEHSISSEQLSLFHSSCGRKPNTLLVKEQVKRSAVIVNHKKKKKKCGGKLDKILNPVEEKPAVHSSSESSSESETDVPEEHTSDPEKSPVVENIPEPLGNPEIAKPVTTVEPPFVNKSVISKEQGPRKPSAYVR